MQFLLLSQEETAGIRKFNITTALDWNIIEKKRTSKGTCLTNKNEWEKRLLREKYETTNMVYRAFNWICFKTFDNEISCHSCSIVSVGSTSSATEFCTYCWVSSSSILWGTRSRWTGRPERYKGRRLYIRGQYTSSLLQLHASFSPNVYETSEVWVRAMATTLIVPFITQEPWKPRGTKKSLW